MITPVFGGDWNDDKKGSGKWIKGKWIKMLKILSKEIKD